MCGLRWSDLKDDRTITVSRALGNGEGGFYEKEPKTGHKRTIPLTQQDLFRFVQTRVVNASEACQILDCSRQNIDDLMKRDKLHPIRSDTKYKLFSKAEVMQRQRK